MNDTTSLLDDYRARLRAASAGLPPDIRDELLDDVEAHLAELRATSPSTEATRDALARLGAPEDVASAAQREFEVPGGAPTGWTPPAEPRLRTSDAIAVALLLVGAIVLPVIGWLIGVAMLWASRSWTGREKLLGTLALPGGLATPFALALLPGQACSYTEVRDEATGVVQRTNEICEGFAFSPWVGVPLLVAMLIVPPLIAAFLVRRARAASAAGVTD